MSEPSEQDIRYSFLSGLAGSTYYSLDDLEFSFGSSSEGPAPTISVAPTSESITEGDNVTFTVTVNGSVDTYQWQTQALGGSWTAVGGNSSTLTLSDVNLSANGTLVRVRAGYLGVFSGYSSPVTLTVEADPLNPISGQLILNGHPMILNSNPLILTV